MAAEDEDYYEKTEKKKFIILLLKWYPKTGSRKNIETKEVEKRSNKKGEVTVL